MEDKILENCLSILNLKLSPKRLKERTLLRVASDDSLPTLSEKGKSEEFFSQLTLDRQITVRPKVTDLSRRDASLLLSVLNYQVVNFGINFSMYLTMEFLVSFLLGNKNDPMEIKDEKERFEVSLSFLILLDFYGEFIPFEGNAELHEDIKQKILVNGLVVNHRVAGGRLSHYRPEKFFEVRAEVLESIYERSGKPSKRYSSYTKGYGESHPSTHKKKVRPSAELDGEEDTEITFRLKDISKFFVLNQLKLYEQEKIKSKKA